MPRLTTISLRRLLLPLIRPYRLSYRTFDEFEPYLVEVADDSGRTGFADGHISPGSSAETRDGGWAFMRKHIPQMLGREPAVAKAELLAHFEILPRRQYVKLVFEDNGIGFDQQYAKQIFTIFQRLNDRQSYSGTGIGLALCKKIVENHQGYISAYSEPGKGARFVIFLPL